MALTDEHIEKHIRTWLCNWKSCGHFGLTANQLAVLVGRSVLETIQLLDNYNYRPTRCDSTRAWVWSLPPTDSFMASQHGYTPSGRPYSRSEAIAGARRQATSRRSHFGTKLGAEWKTKLGVGQITERTVDETCGHCVAEKQLWS